MTSRRRRTPGPTLLGAWAVLLASLVACGRSPEHRRQEGEAQLASWRATLELLARERGRGAVPEGFARQVRQAAEQGSRKARQQLRAAAAP